MDLNFRKITIVLFAFLLLIGFSACEDKNTTELFWHITQCEDPWWAENVELSSTAYRTLMTNYLLANDIVLQDHFLDQNAEADDESCSGCGCKTSFRIRAIFLDDDVESALAIGFTEE